MEHVIQFTTQYDHVLALCIINLLRAKDGTVGDQLSLRSMYSLLITLGLRVPLQENRDERYGKGLHHRALASQRARDCGGAEAHACLLPQAVGGPAQAAVRRVPAGGDVVADDAAHVGIASALRGEALPEDGGSVPTLAKDQHRPQGLLREYVTPVNEEQLANLLAFAKQRENKEITYWTCRLLWSLILRGHVQSDSLPACKEVVLDVLSEVDISLSYRSLLCDLCIMENETPRDDIPFIKGVTSYGRLSLLRDNNPSIQDAMLRLLNGCGGGALVNGFNSTMAEEERRIVESEEGKRSFCSVCTLLFTVFMKNNLPTQLDAERTEVVLAASVEG